MIEWYPIVTESILDYPVLVSLWLPQAADGLGQRRWCGQKMAAIKRRTRPTIDGMMRA